MTDMPSTPNDNDPIPLAWAGSTMEMDYLNFGDALSPVMVALLAGRDITRVPTRSKTTRMAAVGTIGHGFAGGEVWFWGTGCSSWKNPSAPSDERVKFEPPADSTFVITATRGPVSEQLLSGGKGGPGVYGDPVWILPRFYRPNVPKKWKLGVILHLSELADRSNVAKPREGMLRFDIPDELKDDIHLITTVTPIDVKALGDKIDEILACERIVSTSLHGMVIAESYGIPCLNFAPHGPNKGLATVALDPPGDLDLRIVDLYRGLGQTELKLYVQPRGEKTDWADVMAACDSAWKPVTLDEDRLIQAFPLPLDPLVAPHDGTIWDHPVLKNLTLQHEVGALRKADAEASKGKETRRPFVRRTSLRPPDMGIAADPDAPVPVSWAASTADCPYANLGDALSAVMVAALSGRPVRHAAFDQKAERLAAVGTIGHAQKRGHVHFWGTGLDATRNPVDPTLGRYVIPPETRFTVHATRGPRTEAVLKGAGLIYTPGIYGDPVWLLPQIWPMGHVEKTHDIGVIVHLTELEAQTPESGTKAAMKRYAIPAEMEGRIRIINTLTPRTVAGLKAKIEEIAACRIILSTSLHGLVIAETYGIPCAWFATYGEGEETLLDLTDEQTRVDHRMRDFYLGAGATHLPAYCLVRNLDTDWDKAEAFVKRSWQPLSYTGERLAEAFPLPLAAKDENGLWRITEAAEQSFQF